MSRSRTSSADRDLLDLLSKQNKLRRWFRPGDSVLVALSGGIDSVALLDLLAGLAPSHHLLVQAATVDHGLRPFQEELRVTAELCASLHVPHHVLALPQGLADRACRAGTSLQEQARVERYGSLLVAAHRLGAACVATAHHADDQAETVLLRLAAGVGLGGLRGVQAHREDGIVRPLISVRRSELQAHVTARGLPFVEDPTNRSDRYVRNRLRSSVLPALNRAIPSAVVGLARSADLLADEVTAIDALLDERLEAARKQEGPASWLSVAALGDGALRRLLLHRWLHRSGLRHSRAHVLEIEKLLGRPGGGSASTDLPGGVTLRLEYGSIRLEPHELGRPAGDLASPPADASLEDALQPHLPLPARLPEAGECALASGVLVVEACERWPRPPGSGTSHRPSARSPLEAAFQRAALALPLAVRTPRRGDRIAVSATGRGRLVSDLLGEAKVPVRKRSAVPVVVDADGRILWLVGVRRSVHAEPLADAPAVVLCFRPASAHLGPPANPGWSG